MERQFLLFLAEHGYRLPDEAQQTVEGYYVRPDFTFSIPGGDVAIFVDGPIHDSAHQADQDRAARAKLEDEAGWLVLRFHHEDSRTSACGDPPAWLQLVDETTVLLPDLDNPTAATFDAPSIADRRDAARARLLRDALRLSFRATAGPFRSFAQLSVTPRNYQLVPLMMAAAQDTTLRFPQDRGGIHQTRGLTGRPGIARQAGPASKTGRCTRETSG